MQNADVEYSFRRQGTTAEWITVTDSCSICFAMFITVIIYCDKYKRHCMAKIGFPKEAKTERLESKKNPQKPKKKVF